MNQQNLIGQATAEALTYYKNGKFQEAAELCGAIMEVDSKHAPALHLLGLIAHQIGNNEQALDFLSKAIEASAANPVYFNDCGKVCQALGLEDVAANCYRRVNELMSGTSGDKNPGVGTSSPKSVIAPVE